MCGAQITTMFTAVVECVGNTGHAALSNTSA